jgi:hypothetical protein
MSTSHPYLNTIETVDLPTCCSFETRLAYVNLTKDGFATLPTRMQGKCTTQPDTAKFPSMNGVPLVPTTSGQCLLLSSDYLLSVLSDRFWADNLYLRSAVPKGDDREYHFFTLAWLHLSGISPPTPMYMTHMTFQGEGKGSTVGIDADAKVFVSGSHHTCSAA